jgi:hypothetical protein
LLAASLAAARVLPARRSELRPYEWLP